MWWWILTFQKCFTFEVLSCILWLFLTIPKLHSQFCSYLIPQKTWNPECNLSFLFEDKMLCKTYRVSYLLVLEQATHNSKFSNLMKHEFDEIYHSCIWSKYRLIQEYRLRIYLTNRRDKPLCTNIEGKVSLLCKQPLSLHFHLIRMSKCLNGTWHFQRASSSNSIKL